MNDCIHAFVLLNDIDCICIVVLSNQDDVNEDCPTRIITPVNTHNDIAMYQYGYTYQYQH